jgi:hypothetical protein
MTISSSGNVGIGTWVPAKTLNIYGSGNTYMEVDGSGKTTYFGSDGTYGGVIQTSGSTPISFLPGGIAAMNILFGGNVGIGTTTVTGGLAVMNGNVGIGTWVPAYTLDLVNNKSRSRSVFRIVTTTQSATPSINTDSGDVFEMTGLAQAITSMTTNLTGTPLDGDQIEIQITDNGTARAITWGTSFESTGTVTLPTTTVLSVRLNVFLQWSSADSKWMCVGTA